MLIIQMLRQKRKFTERAECFEIISVEIAQKNAEVVITGL